MPSPTPIQLTSGQRRALRQQMARVKSYRAWSRITAVVLLSTGMSVTTVAETLSVSARTISNWKRRWLKGGIFRLDDAPRSGRPPKATPKYRRVLREAVDQGPKAFGYVFTVWNTARLAEHLFHRTRIRLRPGRVRSLLKDLGYVYGRPKHTLKSRQNRRRVRLAKSELAALKKGLYRLLPLLSSGSRTKRTFISIPI
jgi:transposase